MPDSKAYFSGNGDRRAARTRAALLDAFNRLVLGHRKRHIRVADVIAEAKVGRSTFYDHYSGTGALHLDALKRPLGPIAEAAAGRGNEAAVTHILTHFWDFRQRARESFGARTERLLSQMIEELLVETELCIPQSLAARQLAGSAHAIITAWIAGEAPAAPAAIASVLCRSGRAQVDALKP